MDHFPHDPFDGLAAEETERGRDSLFLIADLRPTGSDEGKQVRVRNLSPGGLMAEYQGELAAGTEVECEMRGIGKVSGAVAWVKAGRIGITFDRQIDPMLARKSSRVASKASVYLKPAPRR